VAKETYRTRLSIEIRDWRNDTPDAINFTKKKAPPLFFSAKQSGGGSLTKAGEKSFFKKAPPSPPLRPTFPTRLRGNNPTKKRRKSQSRTLQRQRDKETPPEIKEKTPVTQHTNSFNCYTINIRGLTQPKWKAILNHPGTKEPHAIVIIEHHLPFGHTPFYVTKSGWVFHTIQAPYKKDKDGNPTLGTCGEILIATRVPSPFRKKSTTKLIYTRQQHGPWMQANSSPSST